MVDTTTPLRFCVEEDGVWYHAEGIVPASLLRDALTDVTAIKQRDEAEIVFSARVRLVLTVNTLLKHQYKSRNFEVTWGEIRWLRNRHGQPRLRARN